MCILDAQDSPPFPPLPSQTKSDQTRNGSDQVEKPFSGQIIFLIFPLLEQWPYGSYVNTSGIRGGGGLCPFRGSASKSSSPPSLHTVGIKPISRSLASETGKGRASLPHCSIECRLCFQHTHTHFTNPNVPRPENSFVRDGVQKIDVLLGLPYIPKGMHTSKRTSARPRSSDYDHKRICRISPGSEPAGRDLCALEALTLLPRLGLRSPAPGSSAPRTTRAPAAEPGRQARAHAVSPSPAPRGG